MPEPTQWGSNNSKQQSGWSAVTKNADQWQNNVTKQPAQFKVIGKSTDDWEPEHPIQDYFYNDIDTPYNSSLFEYNYMVNNNTDNQRLVTKWKVA